MGMKGKLALLKEITGRKEKFVGSLIVVMLRN